MSTSFSKREEIIAAIKRCAEKLGRAPSQAEFRRESKISWHQVYRNFRGMRAAVRAAGLEPGPRGSALDINTLTLDWARVVRKLGRLPSRAEYCEHGVHHAGTLHARIVWSQMSHKFVLTVKEFHLELEWADVVQIVVGKFPLLERSTQQSALSIQPREENKQTYHGDTETRRTAEIECASAPMMVIEREPHRELTRIGTNGTEGPPRAQMTTEAAGLESLPLIAANNTDRQQGGMRLGKVVVADLAIEILMAAGRSTQQSAFSNQPEQGNWQSANRNWQKPFTAKDAHPPHQAKPGLAGGPGDAKEEERETNHVEIEHVSLIATDHTEKDAKGLMDMHRACVAGQAPCGRPVIYGEPLGLAAMAHAPTNELGVLFLFGIVAADLGFRVERLQAAFPDCEAKREVTPGKWELVFIELEIYSRNFKTHRHDPRGCHVIVCWKHNWPDCPEWLEVIELSKVVKRPGDREIG